MRKFLQRSAWAGKLKNTTRTLTLRAALLCSAAFWAGTATAQSANQYNFEALQGTFTPLPATAIQVPLLQADSYLMPATTFPNGFVFNFEGVNFTSFKASSDGYISFGSRTSNNNSNNLFTNVNSQFPLLAPLWDNLDGRAVGGSNAAYEVSGQPGAQVFTFEWLNWEYSASSNVPVISFQVKLYEADGKIEFIYRSESGNPVAASASIGIAGNSNHNYISVNNTSANPPSSTSITNSVISTKPATGQIYAFSKPVANDVSAIALSQPGTISCYGPNQTIAVKVKNTGTNTLDFGVNPLTVSANAAGPNPVTFTPATVTSGTLAPGAVLDVEVSTTYNMSAFGTYLFNASAAVTSDGFPANNAMPEATRTTVAPAALPIFVDFTNYTGSNLSAIFPGWEESSGVYTPNSAPNFATGGGSTWLNDNFVNNASHVNGKAAMFNFIDFQAHSWIMSPKFQPVASTLLQFDLALTPWGSSSSTTMGSDDVFLVLISTDCGQSYSLLRTYDSKTPISNAGQKESISLGAYAGQPVKIAFYATDGTVVNQDNEIFLDNIFIGTAPTLDLGLTTLAAPLATGCFTASENVTATVKNFMNTPLDLSLNPATVTVQVTGAVTQTLSTVVNSGLVAPGATLNVPVGTLNMLPAGTYTFNGTAQVSGDGFPFNDAMPERTAQVKPVVSLPQMVDFTGFNSNNLTALFPNWLKGKGTTVPAGTTSNWFHATNLGAAGNITAKLLLYGTGANQNEWLVGPKITATAGTHFIFKAAITDNNSLNPDPDGMDATDKVQVMVSTDCGLSFSPVYTLDAAANLTNVLTEQRVSLAPFAGQQIIVAIFGSGGTTSGTSMYDFHVDDLHLVNLAQADLSATAFSGPAAGNSCANRPQPVLVTIKNQGAASLDFTTQPATVTVHVSGPVSQTLSLNLNANSLNNGNPLLPGAALTVLVDSLNMNLPGTYSFQAIATVTGDGNTSNDTLSTATVVVTGPVAGTATVSATTICNNSPVSLYLTGSTGSTIKWQQATSPNGPFTDIAGAIHAVYITSNLVQNTYFQAIVSCGAFADTSNVILATVLPSGIASVTGDTICQGSRPVTLTVTPTGGSQVAWYGAASGGAPLASGNAYTTQVLGTTTFYAQATVTSNALSLNAHSFNGFLGCAGGNMFDVNPVSDLIINGFDQNLSDAAGTSVTVYIYYKNGSFSGSETSAASWTPLDTVTVISAGPGNATAIPVNALRLQAGQLTGIYIQAPVKYSDLPAPILYSNTDLRISPGTGLCNAFGNVAPNKDWNGTIRYSLVCNATPRTPVTAFVTNGPGQAAVTFAPGSRGIICQGDSSTLIASSLTPGVTYQWLNNGVPIPGATSAAYVAKTTGAFVVVTTNSDGCSATSILYTITVNPRPATPTITQGGDSGQELTSSEHTGNQWYLNGTAIAGAIAQTYTAIANGNYTVVVRDHNYCVSLPSAAVNITNTGIKGAMAGMSVSVYPNPSNGKFNVKLVGYKQDAALELYSLTGQLIAKEEVKAGQEVTKVQVKNLAAGTYLLKVVSEKGVQINKLIVE
ncbi:T9SS type A sorting domain-containing protein [Adhaeribacter sp. BT258]|uniref:T9SS type A sorting domain-containing protein n=1 Tax=Adhaeribacter terrigena TaxID=2793070 RepID=A0ABS1BWZ6_9BACT|nr:choice-of-anchor J domain-containing protein [Adhaeribacter terrigena]MBK0401666.1 T9SS type A sorting domain-containing protein [Adhaeribacter terrigena]